MDMTDILGTKISAKMGKYLPLQGIIKLFKTKLTPRPWCHPI